MSSLPIKLSKTEKKVVNLLNTYPQVYVSEIAKVIFKNVPVADRPKVPSNSVVSAIRQINRKLKAAGYDQRIDGERRGRKKLVYWELTL